MSGKPVEALEAVQADLEYARSFYESWKPGGGKEILQKYFDAVEWIEWNPDLFPRKFGLIQRVILRQLFRGLFLSGRGPLNHRGRLGWAAQPARHPKTGRRTAKIRLAFVWTTIGAHEEFNQQ